MIREFIMMPEFDKMWAKTGLNDEDLKSFNLSYYQIPNRGELLQELVDFEK